MNKNSFVRFTALALALVMVISLAACQRASNDEDARFDLIVGSPDTGAGNGSDGPDDPTVTDDPDDNGSQPLIARPERNLPFTPSAPGFENEDLNVRMIEINQALSYGFDVESGEYYVMQNFVAGKETAIFIAFNEPFDPGSQAVLTVEKDGVTVAQLIPAGIPDDKTLLFQPRDMAEVNNWEAGAYRFIFDMDGGRAVRTANFFVSATLKVLAVPIRGNYSGRVVSCSGEWRNSSTMLSATFPVGKANLEYVLGPELDLSADKYDLNTNEGEYLVWQALSNLQTRNRDYALIIGFVRETMYPPDSRGGILGYTYGMPSSIVCENSPDMLSIVPHEVAHCYNIGDEYPDGSLNLVLNVAPYRMSGRDIMSSARVTARNPNVIGGGDIGLIQSGSVIYEDQRAYWVEGGLQLGLVTSYMGWGGIDDPLTKWTTSDIWNHLYYSLVGQTTSGSVDVDVQDYWGQCPNCFGGCYDPDFYVECWQCLTFTKVTDYEFQCSGCGANWQLTDYEDDLYMECSACKHFIWYNWFEVHNTDKNYAGSTTRREMFIHITGYLDSNGAFTPSPWYTYESELNVVVPSDLGEYCVYIYDSAGALLSQAYFNAKTYSQVVTPGGVFNSDADSLTVDVSARFYENAARIVIQKGGNVIYTQDVSRSAPTVAFTGLSDNQELSDNFTLTWEAADPDGDEMYFDIWYSPAEDSFYNVASNVTGNSYEIDLSSLAGTNAGFFRIYATDGARTTIANSPKIRAPFKAPMILREQTEIPQFKLTDMINYDAEIYDLQDGWMDGDVFLGERSPVIWYYEGQRYYHNSEVTVFPFELTPGFHTFTVVAVNSAGLRAEKEFTFEIVDDDSDLPNDWSRDEVRSALSWGIMLPLDRLDAPVTRGRYAEILVTTYGLYAYFAAGLDPSDIVPHNAYPDYIDGVVTDGTSDWDLWNWFIPVWLGVMEAPGGIFNPTGTLTQREAAIMIYKMAAIALDDPGELDKNLSDDDIIDWFFSKKIFNSDGPNAYLESERLSNRLAMVRTVRFHLEVSYKYLLPYL